MRLDIPFLPHPLLHGAFEHPLALMGVRLTRSSCIPLVQGGIPEQERADRVRNDRKTPESPELHAHPDAGMEVGPGKGGEAGQGGGGPRGLGPGCENTGLRSCPLCTEST